MGAGALIVISLNVVGHSSESGRNNMMERWRHKTGNETSMAASSDPITNSNEIRTWDLNVNLNVEPSHRDRNFSAARPTEPDARAELRKSKRSNLLFYHSLGSTHDTTNRHGWILSFKSTQTRTACSTTRFRIHKHFCFEFSTWTTFHFRFCHWTMKRWMMDVESVMDSSSSWTHDAALMTLSWKLRTGQWALGVKRFVNMRSHQLWAQGPTRLRKTRSQPEELERYRTSSLASRSSIIGVILIMSGGPTLHTTKQGWDSIIQSLNYGHGRGGCFVRDQGSATFLARRSSFANIFRDALMTRWPLYKLRADIGTLDISSSNLSQWAQAPSPARSRSWTE